MNPHQNRVSQTRIEFFSLMNSFKNDLECNLWPYFRYNSYTWWIHKAYYTRVFIHIHYIMKNHQKSAYGEAYYRNRFQRKESVLIALINLIWSEHILLCTNKFDPLTDCKSMEFYFFFFNRKCAHPAVRVDCYTLTLRSGTTLVLLRDRYTDPGVTRNECKKCRVTD